MKRVIKASSIRNVRMHPAVVELRNKIRAFENDLDYLETCETAEDVKQHTFEGFNSGALLRKLEKASDAEFEDILDKALDSYSSYLEHEIEQYSKALYKVRTFAEYVNKLKPYIDIELMPEGWAKINISDSEDLVALVDQINEILGSDYFSTGRGGSWTAYNIMTPERVELQVGKIDEVRNDDCYGVQIVGM